MLLNTTIDLEAIILYGRNSRTANVNNRAKATYVTQYVT